MPTKETHVTKEIVSKSISGEFDVNKQSNSSSWFFSSSNFFGRKLQQLSRDKLEDEEDGEVFASSNIDYDEINNLETGLKDKNTVRHYKQCPKTSPHLLGPLIVQQNNVPALQLGTKEFVKWYGHTLKNGGVSAPKDCMARQKGWYSFFGHFSL